MDDACDAAKGAKATTLVFFSASTPHDKAVLSRVLRGVACPTRYILVCMWRFYAPGEGQFWAPHPLVEINLPRLICAPPCVALNVTLSRPVG